MGLIRRAKNVQPADLRIPRSNEWHFSGSPGAHKTLVGCEDDFSRMRFVVVAGDTVIVEYRLNMLLIAHGF